MEALRFFIGLGLTLSLLGVGVLWVILFVSAAIYCLAESPKEGPGSALAGLLAFVLFITMALFLVAGTIEGIRTTTHTMVKEGK